MADELQRYVRQPLIPTDDEGQRLYLAQELDKISLALENLGYDNLTPEAQETIISNIEKIVSDGGFIWPPGYKGQQLERTGTGPNDVAFRQRDVNTFIQSTQPLDSISYDGDFWVVLGEGFQCNAYEQAMISSGAEGIWLLNQDPQQTYAVGNKIISERDAPGWELEALRTIDVDDASGDALLPDTCSVERSIRDNDEPGGNMVTSDGNFPGYNVWAYSYITKAYAGTSEGPATYQHTSGGNRFMTGSFGDGADINEFRLGWSGMDPGPQPSIAVADVRPAETTSGVITVMYDGTTNSFRVLWNWQDIPTAGKITEQNGITMVPDKFEGTIDGPNDWTSGPGPGAYFRTVRWGQTSHLMWWQDRWPSEGEIASLRQGWLNNDQSTASGNSGELVAFYVRVALGTWLNLLDGVIRVEDPTDGGDTIIWDPDEGEWTTQQRESKTFVKVSEPVDADIIGGLKEGDAWVETYT